MDRSSFFLTGGPTSVLHTEQLPPPISGQVAAANLNFHRLNGSRLGGRRRCVLPLAMTAVLAAASVTACGERDGVTRLTFSGSALGPEAAMVRRQLQRFGEDHPEVDVELRVTPDAADQRHQLYVQWLNARSPEPDVLQLDVIWTAEFAGAGWILPLDISAADSDDFIPAALAASRWRGTLYAVPWFVDLGLLYWRTDLLAAPPRSLSELRDEARRIGAAGATPFGLVWQGARYEGLVTVFLEHLGAFGGGVLDDEGRVIVDRPAAIRALTFMCDAIRRDGIVPSSVLTWQEEQTRFAFQNGDAVFMRNWPYAWRLLQDGARSRVADRFAVAPFPAGDGGRPAAALGGAQLAVNAWSAHPAVARVLVRFLTAPAQMLERARFTGQLPARRSLYETPALAEALPIPSEQVRHLIDAAVPRPVTPVYSELSEILQVRLHRALSGQQTPAAALREAGREIRALLARAGLDSIEQRP
jgi:multiple sugar transport system substrate-binding protein